MNTYQVSIRYRRPDGKLAWFIGTQEAYDKVSAQCIALDVFHAELPGTDPVSVFIEEV